jgi:hypothetical protein
MYNLRHIPTPAVRFNSAMDNPHSARSYNPPGQFTQTNRQLQHQLIFGHVITQMTAINGIKRYGAVNAMMAEFVRRENPSVYKPLDPNKLTKK